ncbi:hypothetical protein D3C80_1217560 [compost metagenome]
MEPAQVVGEQACQQTQAILAGVLREVGMETADYRHPQAPCRAQRTQPQWPFGSDVQHIRALSAPAPQQLVHGHFAPLQAGVAGQAPAAAQHQLRVVLHRRFAGLARAHDLDVMPALAQPFAEAAKGIGDTVDLRWEGFADEGDTQGGCIHDKKCPPAALRACDGLVTCR